MINIYFLGLVTRKDSMDGYFEPHFVLCFRKRFIKSKNDNPTEMVSSNIKIYDKRENKVIVKDITNKEYLIDYFLSLYSEDEVTHKNVKMQGALFWFPCNDYGERIKEMPAIFIRRESDACEYEKLDSRNIMSSILSRERNADDIPLTNVKPKLVQKNMYHYRVRHAEEINARRKQNDQYVSDT